MRNYIKNYGTGAIFNENLAIIFVKAKADTNMVARFLLLILLGG